MSVKKSGWLAAGLAVAASVLLPVAAQAETVVKVGYLKIPPLVTYLYAERSGLFAKEGIKTELVTLNSGPAILSGVVSKSIDIGMTATTPIVLARAQGQPIKLFGTSDYEKASDIRNWIVASKASGIEKVSDLAGKTVAIIGPYTAGDLSVRDFVVSAGVAIDAVKYVSMPFPQMQPALEVGNIDAAMVGEPFHTAIMNSPKIGAKEIAFGGVANLDKIPRFPLGGWFAREDWVNSNPQIAAGFLKALLEAGKALSADRSKVDEILVKDFGMPPPVAAKTPFPVNTETLAADAKDYQILIDALVRTKLIEKTFSAGDLVVSVKP